MAAGVVGAGRGGKDVLVRGWTGLGLYVEVEG